MRPVPAYNPKSTYQEEQQMSDYFRYRAEPDDSRIDVDLIGEMLHWCRRFGCTQAQLRAAVKAVGVFAKDVRKHLGR